MVKRALRFENSLHRDSVGSSHKPTSRGPLPWTLPRNWDKIQDSPLHWPCWTDIYTPAHIASTGYKGKWNPIPLDPLSLSLSLFLSSSAKQKESHSPQALGLVPHLTLKQGMSISKQTIITLWERGRLFSQPILLAFSSPCLTSLFSRNGKFSIPALKSTPLGCLLQNRKALGFQGEIRPKRLIYNSNTVQQQ